MQLERMLSVPRVSGPPRQNALAFAGAEPKGCHMAKVVTVSRSA
jgi:hypothetical protein